MSQHSAIGSKVSIKYTILPYNNYPLNYSIPGVAYLHKVAAKCMTNVMF